VTDPRTVPSPELGMPPSTSRREGFALAVAMIAIVVIGALIAGAFFTSTQEYRIGRNSLVDQRAFAAAEAGVTQPIQGWVKRINLSMTNGTTLPADTLKLPNAGDAYAVRRMTRLNDYTFWVVSDGYAGGTSGSLASQHRVNAVFRLAYPQFAIKGALTVRGQVKVQGSSSIDGTDAIPSDWALGGICPAAGPAVAAVVAPDTSLVCSGPLCPGDDGLRMTGDPPKIQDPAAADTNTYYKYGDQNWNLLVLNSDIKMTGGNYKTLPVVTSGTCNYSVTTNWGDPQRSGVCQDYFPIIYVDGDLDIQSNSRGQGVLLVNGSMRMAGNFMFNGIVIVRNDINSTGTGNKITGGAFAGNTYTTDNSSILGDSEIHYSSCAIDRAAKGSATVVRMKGRGFAEIIQ